MRDMFSEIAGTETKTRGAIAITKKTLDALKPTGKDAVLWDKKLKGFGIRLGRDGRVAFIVQYRNAQGASKRITIGAFGSPYTADTARAEAERLLGQARAARHGWDDIRDPAARRAEERTAITFRQLWDEYYGKATTGLILVDGRPKRPATLRTDRFRAKHLLGHFGDKVIKDIDRRDCQRCLGVLIAGKHGAARTFGLLGGVFSYAVDQQYITANPASGISKPADGARVFKLSKDGYRELGKRLEAAEACGDDWRAIGAIRLIALGGFRLGEVLQLKKTEIDLEGRCIRKESTKTGGSAAEQQNVRPLSGAAIEVLKGLVRRAGGSPWVFPGRKHGRPYKCIGGATAGAWERIVGGGYSAHSLRHAFASACFDIGLSELTIAHLVGHVSARRGSMTRRYIHVDATLLAAADQIGIYISSAMTAGEGGGA